MTDDQPTPSPEPAPAAETSEPAVMGRVLAALLFLLGAGGALTALWLAQSDPTVRGAPLTWLLLIGGVSCAVAGTWLVGRPPVGWRPVGWALGLTRRLGVRPWQLACLVMALPLGCMASWAAGSGAYMTQPWLAVGGWMGAIGLAIAGGWRAGGRRVRVSWGVPALCLLFIAAAFAVRAVDTTHIPNVLTGDEGSSGLSAVEFVEGRTNNIFRTGWFSFPSLFYFLQSLTIDLLGRTIPALRLPAALGGALTVGAVYLLGGYLFGNWVGIFSALFLLAYNYHNHFSRIGLNNIWDGLWFTAALGLFIHGWREERRSSLLWAGLCLGLAQYFYVTGRLLVVLPLAFCLLALWFDRPRLKRNLPGILLMYFVFLVTYLPLLTFYLGNPSEFSAPLNRVTLFGPWLAEQIASSGLPAWRVVVNQVWLSLQGFFLIPLEMWYRPETPMLRPIPAALFLIGMAILLVRIKDSRSILLWLWVPALGITGGLSEGAPAAQRYVAVAPALALVIGFGVQESTRAIGGLWPRRSKENSRLAGWIALALVLLLALSELHFYYFTYTPRSDWGLNNQVAQRLADRLQEEEAGLQVAFFGFPRMGYYSHSSVAYLNPHVTGYDFTLPWGDPANPLLTGERVVFIVLPEHIEDLEKIRQAYPEGRLGVEENAAGQMLFWRYAVDR